MMTTSTTRKMDLAAIVLIFIALFSVYQQYAADAKSQKRAKPDPTAINPELQARSRRDPTPRNASLVLAGTFDFQGDYHELEATGHHVFLGAPNFPTTGMQIIDAADSAPNLRRGTSPTQLGLCSIS